MYPKLEFLMIAYLVVFPSKLLTGIGSILIIVYYLSMLKVNVIDKYHNRKWKNYILSIFLKHKNKNIK